VLLLDEPLSALDASVRASLRDEIRRVQQTLGTTTVFITHDQGEALAIADRVAVMNAGRIEQYSAPHAVYTTPKTPFVARFVGSINEFAEPSSWTVRDRLPIDADSADTVFLRPENLATAAVDDGFLEIKRQTYTGERTMIHLGLPGDDRSRWSASLASAEAASMRPGTRVDASLTAAPALRLEADEVGQAWDSVASRVRPSTASASSATPSSRGSISWPAACCASGPWTFRPSSCAGSPPPRRS